MRSAEIRWAECEQRQLFQGISLQVAKRIKNAKASGKTNEAARCERLKEKLGEAANFPLRKTGKKPGFYQLDHQIGVLDRKSKSFKFDSAGLSEAPPGDPETEFAESDNLDVAATDLLDAAEDATIEKRILQAFAGDKLVFEAFSNAITIHGEWRNIGNANSDDVRKQIDRLVFFNANQNHEEALWMLPVINGELGKLRVRNEGGTDARLEVEGKYRAFAFISGSESLGFEIEINHQNTGVNRRLYFKKLEAGIDEKNNFLLEELPSRKFSREVKRGFEASQLLAKLGLKCGLIEDTYQLTQTLSFVPNSKFKERSDEYPKFVMDIFTEIGLTSSDEPNQKIILFAVEAFRWNEMPLKREANGTNFWHYVEVVQKQPHTTK